jgi:hypothetical protein
MQKPHILVKEKGCHSTATQLAVAVADWLRGVWEGGGGMDYFPGRPYLHSKNYNIFFRKSR